MPKYVVHLSPMTNGAGEDMPAKFDIEAATLVIEKGVVTFWSGAGDEPPGVDLTRRQWDGVRGSGKVVAAFPEHSLRAVVQVDLTT